MTSAAPTHVPVTSRNEMMEALGSPEAARRLAALRELGARDELDENTLLRLARDTDSAVREEALRELALLDTAPARAALVHALADPAEGVRALACAAIADIRDETLAGHLVPLVNDKARAVRYEAALALANLGRGEGTDELIAGLGNKSERFDVLRALTAHPNPATEAAVRKVFKGWFVHAVEKLQAAAALARLGHGDAHEYILARLSSKSVQERGFAMEIAGEIDLVDAIPHLQTLLATEGHVHQGRAAIVLGKLRQTACIEQFFTLLRHEDPELRADGARALAALGDHRGALAIGKAIEREADDAARSAMLDALEQLQASGTAP